MSLEVKWDETLQAINLALAFDFDTTNEQVIVDFRNRGGLKAPFSLNYLKTCKWALASR